VGDVNAFDSLGLLHCVYIINRMHHVCYSDTAMYQPESGIFAELVNIGALCGKKNHVVFTRLFHDAHRGVATGWTLLVTSTPLFSEGVSGIESLWSVLISFRLHPQTLPPDLEGDTPPHTQLIMSTPLCLTWQRPWMLTIMRDSSLTYTQRMLYAAFMAVVAWVTLSAASVTLCVCLCVSVS